MMEELQGNTSAGKGILVIQWQELSRIVIQKAEFVSGGLGYLVEGNFQVIVRGAAHFLLAAYPRGNPKMEGRIKQNRTRIDDFGDSQPIHIVKEVKIR